MKFSLIQDKNTGKAVDIREAFILWDILASKYLMMDQLQTWEKVANDAALKRLIYKNKADISDNIELLSKHMEKHIIPSPSKSRAFANQRGSGLEELMTDRVIAMNIFFYLQEHIENILTGIHRSHTNDALRKLFMGVLGKTVNLLDEVILNMGKRGWHSVPPSYKPLPPGLNEELSCSEAANLWDHLAIRYDNLHVSEVISNLVHDKDFKAALDVGVELLVKQINLLEQEMVRFGIEAPERPSDIALPKELKLHFSDRHFYRELLNGIHGASLIHAKSFKQCTTNHRVRKLFKDLLMVEIEKFDDFIKFGKMKQWLNAVPLYIP